MTHTIDFSLATSEEIENALSQRIEAIRLRQNITQQELARIAGVSRSTITRLGQEDKGISLDSFIRILKALQLDEHLAALLPEPGISPLEILERGGEAPQRVSAKKAKARQKKWQWGDQGRKDKGIEKGSRP